MSEIGVNAITIHFGRFFAFSSVKVLLLMKFKDSIESFVSERFRRASGKRNRTFTDNYKSHLSANSGFGLFDDDYIVYREAEGN